jgi:ribonuclease III
MASVADRETLEQRLGYEFKNSELIAEALTHKSHFHENRARSHNERLEFLGDTFVNFCVSEHLTRTSPHLSEGQLSKLRSQIVSEKGLSQVAKKLNLGSYILLGRGEELSGGRSRESLLADTLEALFAALYIDAGFESAREIIIKSFELHTQKMSARKAKEIIKRDHKSRLQEMCQSLDLGTPVYRCLDTLGPDHLKNFTMGVYLRGVEISRATSTTKKLATQLAAEMVLKMSKNSKQLKGYLRSQGVLIESVVKIKEEPNHESRLR